MQPLENFYRRYREIVLYLVAGALTTAINYLTYLLCAHLLPDFSGRTVTATFIAWVFSVIFAYLINRRWVFRSQTTGLGPVFRELAVFLAARLFSGALDVGIMYLAVDGMGLNDRIVKLASNVLVVILNYIFSKLFIFRR